MGACFLAVKDLKHGSYADERDIPSTRFGMTEGREGSVELTQTLQESCSPFVKCGRRSWLLCRSNKSVGKSALS